MSSRETQLKIQELTHLSSTSSLSYCGTENQFMKCFIKHLKKLSVHNNKDFCEKKNHLSSPRLHLFENKYSKKTKNKQKKNSSKYYYI